MTVNRSSNFFIPRKNYFAAAPSFVRGKLLQQGLDPDIALPLAQGLQGIFNKFAVDERLNYDIIEAGLGTVGSGDSKLTIAASNTVLGRRSADLVCDGSNDHTDINTAIADLCPDGGRVEFLEGTYDIGGSIAMTSSDGWNDFHIHGAGASTIFDANSAITIIDYGGVSGTHNRLIVSQIRFKDGATGIKSDIPDTEIIITNCFFESQTSQGILVEDSSQGGLIFGNLFKSCNSAGIRFSNTGHVSIIENIFESGGSSGQIALDNADSSIVIGNIMRNSTGDAVYMSSTIDNYISGNWIFDPSEYGIRLDCSPFDALDVVIVDNKIKLCGEHSIYMVAGFGKIPDMRISGNVIQDGAKDGIRLHLGFGSSDDIVISDNQIIDNGTASGTFNGIYLDGEGLRPFIHGNKIVGTSHDNGINIADANISDALIVCNDIRSGYGTNKISDSGTGTLLNMDGSANDWNLG